MSSVRAERVEAGGAADVPGRHPTAPAEDGAGPGLAAVAAAARAPGAGRRVLTLAAPATGSWTFSLHSEKATTVHAVLNATLLGYSRFLEILAGFVLYGFDDGSRVSLMARSRLVVRDR